MTNDETVEYEGALAHYRHFATLRRQDMGFVVTVQALVLAFVKKDLFQFGSVHIPLTAAAFLVAFLGLNSERRLSAYMAGYMDRAKEIEKGNNMSLFRISHEAVFMLPFYGIILHDKL